MARGWESKSVEQQIENARHHQGEHRVRLTPEQIEVERKRDSIQLQCTRMRNQLEKCVEGRYRVTLEEGLKFLEKQLADLG